MTDTQQAPPSALDMARNLAANVHAYGEAEIPDYDIATRNAVAARQHHSGELAAQMAAVAIAEELRAIRRELAGLRADVADIAAEFRR